ncbi:MAG: hypothetical protein EOM90_18535 [Alphaproteobacteria bacterium]|nr:hypothetical protein [Alphaproteobacteria bacterium]
MPINYKKYPQNWKTEIRPAILKRAQNKCEMCGIENGMTGYREASGNFVPAEGLQADTALEDGERIFRVVLTVAHLNHDIGDNRPENLRALCQRCHLIHDKEHHRASRWNNKHKNNGELGL